MQGNITDWGKEVKKGLIERGWSRRFCSDESPEAGRAGY